MLTEEYLAFLKRHGAHFDEKYHGIPAQDHPVPYGTVLSRDVVPGTSCLATIALSLRDKSPRRRLWIGDGCHEPRLEGRKREKRDGGRFACTTEKRPTTTIGKRKREASGLEVRLNGAYRLTLRSRVVYHLGPAVVALDLGAPRDFIGDCTSRRL
jgi:hypothetical protein